MKLAYVLIGMAMFALGGFASLDLISNSGFSTIQKPVLGSWGFLGPLVAFTGLVFVKFQGRRFASRFLGAAVIAGAILQSIGLLPFVQPRILTPTPGHAGMGLNEIISGFMMLGGMAGFLLSVVCLFAAGSKEA